MGPESAKLLPKPSANAKKSDPICSSSGWCGYDPTPKKAGEGPVVYPTGLPLDKDIIDSKKNLNDTEKALGPWNLNVTKTALAKADKAIASAHKAVAPIKKTAV